MKKEKYELWKISCGSKVKLLGVGNSEREATKDAWGELERIANNKGLSYGGDTDEEIYDYVSGAYGDYRFYEVGSADEEDGDDL
jgi:hypothetical protein